jgi:hypothetical protein
MCAERISELRAELGGLAAVLGEATGAERAEVYASLGFRLDTSKESSHTADHDGFCVVDAQTSASLVAADGSG